MASCPPRLCIKLLVNGYIQYFLMMSKNANGISTSSDKQVKTLLYI